MTEIVKKDRFNGAGTYALYGDDQHDLAVVRKLQATCFGDSTEAGWHDTPHEVGTRLALIHSEVSEAMEGFRRDLMDDHLPHRKMAEVELADALIRIMDLAGEHGFDLAGATVEKLAYNRQRADHKREARAEAQGKKW